MSEDPKDPQGVRSYPGSLLHTLLAIVITANPRGHSCTGCVS